MKEKLFDEFRLGVNYWPRHRGVKMWTDWHPEEIEVEFKEMKSTGINTARIFLTWNDFQPIKEFRGGGNIGEPTKICLRHDESQTIKNNPELIDYRMIKRFDQLIKIAKKYQIKIIPALIVGWMGGNCLDIDFRNGRNIFTDPTMLHYQVLYFRYFAKRYKDEDTILAWDFGNETNAFQPCRSVDAQWNWMNTLASTIRLYDKKHPVLPGIWTDNISKKDGGWHLQTMGELCDCMTPHTYMIFCPEATDETLSLKGTYLPSWRSRLCAGVGGKPAMTEEISTVGTSYMSDKTSALYLRTVLYSLLANEDLGFLWWAHSDFTTTDMVPYSTYSTNANEEEGLGLFTAYGKPKLQAKEMLSFFKILKNINYKEMKKEKVQAAIVLSPEGAWDAQERNGIGYTAYVLSKMAGMDADIITSEQDFDKYKLLICPAMNGLPPIKYEDERRIEEFVKNGGNLYLSIHDGNWEKFQKMFGLKIISKKMIKGEDVTIDFKEEWGYLTKGKELTYKTDKYWKTLGSSLGCEVVATLSGDDNMPALIVNKYGKGKIILCMYPIEYCLSSLPDALDKDDTYLIYKNLKKISKIDAGVEVNNPFLETVLFDAKKERYLIIINHSKNNINKKIVIAQKIQNAVNIENNEKVRLTTMGDITELEIGVIGNSGIIIKY